MTFFFILNRVLQEINDFFTTEDPVRKELLGNAILRQGVFWLILGLFFLFFYDFLFKKPDLYSDSRSWLKDIRYIVYIVVALFLILLMLLNMP